MKATIKTAVIIELTGEEAEHLRSFLLNSGASSAEESIPTLYNLYIELETLKDNCQI